MPPDEGVRVEELRVLDGPNLYFTRPAIKLTLSTPVWLGMPEDRAVRLAGRLRLPGGGEARRPGSPGGERRARFVARIAAHLARRLAAAARVRLAVRSRPGTTPGTIVVAYPWRRREAARAFGAELAALLGAAAATRRSIEGLAAEASTRLAAVTPGPGPGCPEPAVPVIAVTGTNGKTTTVRLLAHLGRTAGWSVAYSSTDGVFRDGELIEEGDYSGFGGAGRALAQPGIDCAVLETARGGILLRGIGTMHNDAAVVTNVSADHLGLHGVDTVDQLAEVKSTVVRITRREGWDVLNADDPRVLAMRRAARGRPWLISTDPDHPALRSALEAGGRATTVLDGAISILAPGRDPRPLASLRDVPLTLAGISTPFTLNALGAASAAVAVGMPERGVGRGLTTFVPDPESNPGRTNLFELDGRVIVVDFAHNEAGMRALTEVCLGLRPPAGRLLLAFASAGDRTDEILHALGYVAARAADLVAVAELPKYLRGRAAPDVVGRLVAGAIDGGAERVPVFPGEVEALEWMLRESRPGDVVGIAALGQRAKVLALLAERGATRPSLGRVRRMVAGASRGRSPRYAAEDPR